MADRFQMTRAQVRAEKALRINAHLVQIAAVAEFAQVDAQVDERGADRRADAQDHDHVEQAVHASLQRSRRLS
ncbi:hypothetical protein D3C75_1181230 [compost metagenome]